MKKKMKHFFKKIGVIVVALAMLITMIPSTEYSADADINGPVIENYSFEQNGAELKTGDKLVLTFSGYDQESEIVFVYTTGVYDVNGNFLQEFKGSVIKGEDGTYTMEYMVESSTSGTCYIKELKFVDSNNNITSIPVDYSFTVLKNYDENTVLSITSDKSAIVFDEDNFTGELTTMATVTGNEKEIHRIEIAYDVKNNDGYIHQEIVQLGLCSDGTYAFTLSFEKPIQSCTYVAKEVHVSYADGTSAYLKNVPSYSFSIQNNISDITGPEILNIEIDKNGQIVETGDVKFTIKASDSSALADEGHLFLQAGVENAENYKHVELMHIGDGIYEGMVSVESMYTCNWFISDINIYDIFNNESNVIYSDVKQYGFGVMRDGVYFEGAYKDVYLNFWQDSYYDVSPLKTFVKDVPHSGIKLGDLLGDEYFEVVGDESLGAFVGWIDKDSGEIYTKDSILKAKWDGDVFTFEPKFEKNSYRIHIRELDSDGEYTYRTIEYVSDKEMTVSELLAVLGNGSNVGGYTFTGWKTDYEDLNTIVKDVDITVYAMYDKHPLLIEFVYLDTNGNPVLFEGKYNYASGTKLQTVVDDVISKIGSSNLVGVIGWRTSAFLGEFDSIMAENVENYGYFSLVANYADKQIVEYTVNYITEKDGLGLEQYHTGYIALDKGALTEEKVKEKVCTTIGTIHHWSVLNLIDTSYYFDKQDGYITSVSQNSYYDNILLYLGRDVNDTVVYNVTAGQVVNLPTELNGKQIGWYSYTDGKTYFGSYTIPTDAVKGDSYWLDATSNTNDAIIDKNTIVEKPAVVLDEKKIKETIVDIKDAISKLESTGEKQTIIVDMKTEDGKVATQVPKEILEAAKGKNVDIVLNMGAYSWTINGTDIKAENLKDINLEVSLNTTNIPTETIKKIAGDKKTYQLSLTHNGDFGFKATLTLNVGAENVGLYGNLYYYDNDGKLVFQNAGKIDENGNVSVSFSHASEYVIVISETVDVNSPKTADNSNKALCMGLLFTAYVIFFVTKKRNFVL